MRRYLVLALLVACHPRPFARPDFGALGHKILVSLQTSGPYVAAPTEAPPEAPPEETPPPEEAPPEEAPPVVVEPAPSPRPRHAKPPRTTPAPAPMPTITKTTRPAPKAVFAAHAQTKAGANSCTTHATMEQCTSHCTSVLRASSMDRSPTAIRSCNCVEAGC